MLANAEHAVGASGGDLRARFSLLECLIYCGRPDRVREELQDLEQSSSTNALLWSRIGEFYAVLADHESALRA